MISKQKPVSRDDTLLFTTFQYYTIPALYLIAIALIQAFHNPWIPIWLVYTLIPLLDEIFTLDIRNPTKEESKKLENDPKFKIPLYICIISEWMLTFWMLNFLTTHEICMIDTLGIIFICSNLAASNINIAHELFHKDDLLDKSLGTLTLARNLYMHFAIEHVFGHHRNVSTPKDPAFSAQGQTLYNFLPQTIIGGFKSAWNFEAALVKRRTGKEYGIQNRMIWFCVADVLIVLAVFMSYGFFGSIYYLISVLISVVYLESINYIEHYGLRRKEISPGVYEPVDIRHSWNAPHRLSNYLLFKLQRHSDHHENPYKPYQILCSYDESPTLPHGYTVCIVLSWFPSKWFEIMDAQLESWKQGSKDIHLSNLKNSAQNQKLLSFIYKVGIFTTSMAALSIAY